MGELSAFDELMLSIRPVFDFMLNLWQAIPYEARFVLALFIGVAVGYIALRTFIQ